ncbi:MAG TPA: hypothetical protein VKW06_10415 [Candidatus Angelobacter sp.]|nr:hypothetical protein [Candidatus Angelobacter sp.]
MDYSQLIVTLVGLGVEYGPQLVKDIANLIHQDPTATVEQINAKITASLDAAKQNDAKVEGGDTSGS